MMHGWKSGLIGLGLALATTAGARAADAKAYVVNEITVTDPAKFQAYSALATPTVLAFGGRYIVRGGNGAAIAGAPPAARIVIVEFPSRAAAIAWHDSADYQKALAIRNAASTSRVYVVDGVAP